MRLPIIVGSSEKIERTGAVFHGECPRCGTLQRFHKATKRFNVSAFFAVSLWDSAEDVAQCESCLSCYADGAIEPVAPRSPASSVVSRVAELFKKSADEKPSVATSPKPTREAPTEQDVEADLKALKKRLGKG